jgi:hypothetical protein
MLELSPEIQKALMALATTAAGGLMMWLGLSARRSFKNAGRTELEIALEDLRLAMEAERIALANADPSDDKAAKAAVEHARKVVNAKKRVKAWLDGAAGDVE